MNHSYLHECEFNISFVSSKSFLACWKLSLTLILFILKYFYSFFSKFSISFLLIFYHFSFLCIQSQKRSSLTVLLSLVFNMIFLLSSVSVICRDCQGLLVSRFLLLLILLVFWKPNSDGVLGMVIFELNRISCLMSSLGLAGQIFTPNFSQIWLTWVFRADKLRLISFLDLLVLSGLAL